MSLTRRTFLVLVAAGLSGRSALAQDGGPAPSGNGSADETGADGAAEDSAGEPTDSADAAPSTAPSLSWSVGGHGASGVWTAAMARVPAWPVSVAPPRRQW